MHSPIQSREAHPAHVSRGAVRLNNTIRAAERVHSEALNGKNAACTGKVLAAFNSCCVLIYFVVGAGAAPASFGGIPMTFTPAPRETSIAQMTSWYFTAGSPFTNMIFSGRGS
jgi:hypothetical protein